MESQVTIERRDLDAFCRRHGVRRLSFFGSVLAPEFGPDSHVDVLVEFEPGARVGLFELSRMEHELSTLIGRAVDLREPEELSPYFRADVVAGAEVQFAAA